MFKQVLFNYIIEENYLLWTTVFFIYYKEELYMYTCTMNEVGYKYSNDAMDNVINHLYNYICCHSDCGEFRCAGCLQADLWPWG